MTLASFVKSQTVRQGPLEALKRVDEAGYVQIFHKRRPRGFDVDPETAIDIAKTGYVSVVEPGENVVFEKVAVAKASQGNLRGVPVTRSNLGVPFGRHIDGRARVREFRFGSSGSASAVSLYASIGA